MQTLLESLRSIVGEPNFYKQMTSTSNYTWDYGAMIEYFCAVLILVVVISSVFRLLGKVVSR